MNNLPEKAHCKACDRTLPIERFAIIVRDMARRPAPRCRHCQMCARQATRLNCKASARGDDSRVSLEVVYELRKRSKDRCQARLGRRRCSKPATAIRQRVPWSLGGHNTASNLMHTCKGCCLKLNGALKHIDASRATMSALQKRLRKLR